MPRRYAVSKRKSSKSSPWLPAVLWGFAVALSVWVLWIQLPTGSKGFLGTFVSRSLFDLLGQAAYLFSPLMLYGLAVVLRNFRKGSSGIITMSIGITLILLSLATELSLLRQVFQGSRIDGGAAGNFLSDFLSGIFGPVGAGLFGIAIFLAGMHTLFAISWRSIISGTFKAIKEDYAGWAQSRMELNSQMEEAKAKKEAAKEDDSEEIEPEPKEIPKPQIVRGDVSKPQPQKKTAEAPVAPAKETKPKKEGEFVLPAMDLLNGPPQDRIIGPSDEEINNATRKLTETLNSFQVDASVSGALAGPVITRYEIKPNPGVKVSSIVSLSNDIALAMKARGIRVEAPIPGKDAIGFEIPNEKPVMVYLREILESEPFRKMKSPLAVALGRYADGSPAMANLEKMPHLLVAGATNSGKSICLQTLVVSILYRASPDQVKFLMIDPKRLELTFYEKIPHLYDPKVPCEEATVVTDPKGAVASLKALVRVMETRYKIFEAAKVKNIESYNRWAAQNNQKPAFYIIVIIDELADLMLQTKAAVEDSIQRLAQMARAVGIHLVLSTQRPSVNVITGVIKANLPSRIALQVASKMDSRVILDYPGAESLLGKGDMLFLAIDAQKPSRIQGAYVSEEEIAKVADCLRAQGGPDYPVQIPDAKPDGMPDGFGISVEEFKAALRLIIERRRVSQDLLKAHFGSSARATNILSVLEIQGFITKPEGSNRWEIQFEKMEHQLSMLESQQALETAPSSVPEGNDE